MGRAAKPYTQLGLIEHELRQFIDSGRKFVWDNPRSFTILFNADRTFGNYLFGKFNCPILTGQKISTYNCVSCGLSENCPKFKNMTTILQSIESSMKFYDGVVREKRGQCPGIPNEVRLCDVCPREPEMIKMRMSRGKCADTCIGQTLLRIE